MSAPVRLVCYDPDGDDRRGTENDMGLYRSRANAQARADHNNAEELARWNANRRRENEAEKRRTAENNALVDAGLRETRWSIPHVDWVDVESVESLRYRMTGIRWYVEDVEYDDD